MNSVTNELKRLKKLIAQNNLDTAFEEFATLLDKIDTYKEQKQGIENIYLVLSSEKKSIDDIGLLGTSDSVKLGQMYARINSAFLGLINTVESLTLNGNDSATHKDTLKNNNHDLSFWNNQNTIKLEHFKPNYSSLFQGFPINHKPNSSEKAILDVYNTLVSRKSTQHDYWMDKAGDDSFSLIYINTSVLYFLLQLGLDLSHSECDKAVKYIDTIKEISIDNRAKWYFDIQTDRISSPNALEFITLLEKEQITKGNAKGAFRLFVHGNEKAQQTHLLPIHYGGYSLHACLIADTLLHIAPKHTIARRKATDMLRNIESFLTTMAKENDGYLLGGNHKNNDQYTTWYFFLCKKLGTPLPATWETQIVEILERQEEDIFKASFLAMNISLILSEYSNSMQLQTIENMLQYFELFYEKFHSKYENEKDTISTVNLSIFGRALLYINKALKNDIANIVKK